MIVIPPLPETQDGWDFINELSHGWQAIGLWGRDGWNLGSWPYVVVAHYDGDGLYAVATRVEGDIEIKQFTSYDERNKETNRIAVFYWQHYEVESAPQDVSDSRLGPYVW